MILDFSFSTLNNAVPKGKVISCAYRLSIFAVVYSASIDS